MCSHVKAAEDLPLTFPEDKYNTQGLNRSIVAARTLNGILNNRCSRTSLAFHTSGSLSCRANSLIAPRHTSLISTTTVLYLFFKIVFISSFQSGKTLLLENRNRILIFEHDSAGEVFDIINKIRRANEPPDSKNLKNFLRESILSSRVHLLLLKRKTG